ncbi:Secretory lipase [Chryseolinea serpens]|uniref:Secretory lipase n=1 Tax=Chryseolinea serpens TaxID=947013 RepID=A0A1M5S386_9BACT|nr:alpha/beta fold hydrolase [Chryseolinea serpens]SHH32916.1 Secretory lipase [Chryseolinea serpens]
MKFLRGVCCLLVILFVSTRCSDNDQPSANDPNGKLIESISAGTTPAATLKLLVTISGYKIDPSILKHDVEIFKVKYHTQFQGEDITASGLIILPQTNESVSMLSFQHGTTTLASDAPSVQSTGSFDVELYSAIASAGFVAVVPDMIGFGSSSTTFHPYYVEEPTARAVSDMIVAARELADQKKLAFDGKLFLAGYSQGGYATMAAHKAIESEPLAGMTLVASFPAAGGFDLKAIQEYLFSQTEYADPYYLAYLVNSYQQYYKENNLLKDFFNEPYASAIPGLFDGQHAPSSIDAQLTTSMKDLVSDDLREGIDTQPRFNYIVALLNENSLVNQWYPKTVMYVYHGVDDTTVPYSNSESTYQKLIANGASAEQLHFISLEGDHGSAVKPYVEDLVPRLMALK